MKVGDLVYHRNRGLASSWINEPGIVVDISVRNKATLIDVHWMRFGKDTLDICGYMPCELRLIDESR
jgi:hypothetical protein